MLVIMLLLSGTFFFYFFIQIKNRKNMGGFDGDSECENLSYEDIQKKYEKYNMK